MSPGHPGEGLALTVFSPRADSLWSSAPLWVGSMCLSHKTVFGREHVTVSLRICHALETVSFYDS